MRTGVMARAQRAPNLYSSLFGVDRCPIDLVDSPHAPVCSPRGGQSCGRSFRVRAKGSPMKLNRVGRREGRAGRGLGARWGRRVPRVELLPALLTVIFASVLASAAPMPDEPKVSGQPEPRLSATSDAGIAPFPVHLTAGRGGDECGPDSLTQSDNPDLIGNGSAWCGDTQFSAETSLARAFVMPTNTALSCVTFGVRSNTGGDWPVAVRVLQGPIEGAYDALTVLSHSEVVIPGGTTFTFVTAPVGELFLVGGQEYIFELLVPSREIADGGDGGLLQLGFNAAGQSAPTYIRAPACGLQDFADLAEEGFPNRHLVMSLAVAGSPPSGCEPQSITDPGFETGALGNYNTVLNDFQTNQGQWGAEAGSIVGGPTDGVVPRTGASMLRLTDDFLTATQAVQVIDVTALGGLIDLGLIEADFSGHFNASAGLNGAVCGVVIRAFSGPSYGSLISSVTASLVLDGNVGTWEHHGLTARIVPAGTRWIVVEVLFTDASIGSLSGFVDDTFLCLRRFNRFGEDCGVYWVDGGGGTPRLETAGYAGFNRTTFDPLVLGTTNPFIAYDPSPRSIFWKESGLIYSSPLPAPAAGVVVAAAPCTAEASMIATSATDVYLSCVQSLQIWRQPKNGAAAVLLPPTPAQLGTLRAMAFHRIDNELYIAHDDTNGALRISTTDANGNNLTQLPLVAAPPGFGTTVHDIAFDYIGNALYVLGRYTERFSPDQSFIMRYSLTSFTGQVVLLDSPGGAAGDPVGLLASEYHGIAVDSHRGLMWWTSRDFATLDAQVRMMRLNGTTPAVIASSPLPRGYAGIVASLCCPADLNADAVVDFFDIQMFLGWFAAGNPLADFNLDGIFDFFDIQAYLNVFAEGCP